MSLFSKSLKILLGGVILTATLNARNLYIIDSPSEVKNYVSKATKGDFAVVKTDGVFVRYIFDGKNFVALEDRDLLKSASSSLPFKGYLKSCKEILDKGQSHGDGVYTIDPDGKGGVKPFKVYCDMTTDGGGWTLVARIHNGYTGVHRTRSAVGILLSPNQTTTAKFSDVIINKIRGNYNLSVIRIQTDSGKKDYFKENKEFNAVGYQDSINQVYNTYKDAINDTEPCRGVYNSQYHTGLVGWGCYNYFLYGDNPGFRNHDYYQAGSVWVK